MNHQWKGTHKLCLIGKDKLPVSHWGWDRLDTKNCINTVNYRWEGASRNAAIILGGILWQELSALTAPSHLLSRELNP